MASKKILIQVDVTTKSAEVQINKVVDSMNKLEGATAKFADTTKKSRAQSGLNNAILIESGRFASDLRFGFTAVANNLGRIIELGQEFSRTEGGGLIPALKRIISFQGLFLIGFQLLVAYGDKVFAFLKGLVTEVNTTTDIFDKASKNVSDINSNFEIYIATLQSSTKSEKEKQIAIKKLNEEYPDYIDNLEKADVTLEDVKNKTKAATEQNNLYRDSILELAISRAAQNEIERISSEILQAEIDLKKIQIEQGIETEEQLRQALIDKQAEIDAEQLLVNAAIKAKAQNKSRAASDFAIDKTRLNNLKREKAALEGNLKANLGLGKSINEKIEALKAERDLYIEYIKLSNEKNQADIEENEYTKLKVGNFDLEIQAIKDLGRIRKRFFDLNQKQDVEDKESEEEKLVLRRQQALAEVDALKTSETLKRQARLEINTYFDKLDLQQEEATAEAKKSIQLGIVSAYAKALGSLSQLLGKNTAAGKVAALGEIAAGTAVGFIQALDIAQKAAKGTGPLASLAFPVFYASQVAAVLGAAAQAKQVLESGGRTSASRPTAGTTAPSITTEAPDFNVVGIGGVSQLGQVIGAQFGQPLRAYVVSSDVRTGQALERNITGNAKLG
jgi:hypothetical protein